MAAPRDLARFRANFVITFTDGRNSLRQSNVYFFDIRTETFFCFIRDSQHQGGVIRVNMENTRSIAFNNEIYNLPQHRARFLIGFINYMRRFSSSPDQRQPNRMPGQIVNDLSQGYHRTCARCGNNLPPRAINNSGDFVMAWNGKHHQELSDRIRELRYQASRDFAHVFGDPARRILTPLSLRAIYKYLLDTMGPTVRRVTPKAE